MYPLSPSKAFPVHVSALPIPIFPQEPKYFMWHWLPTTHNCGNLPKAVIFILESFLRETTTKHHRSFFIICCIIYSSKQPDEVNTAIFILPMKELMFMEIKYLSCLWLHTVSFSFQCNTLSDQLI